MNYSIHITSSAERDINNAVDYIDFTLKNPDAADNLLDAAEEQIGSLAKMPGRCPIVNDPVLASWKIRFITVKNYLAFYTIDEDQHIVNVVRFLYKKSNWSMILHQHFLSDTEQ
jgi:plasmid stabilization system protein ParE